MTQKQINENKSFVAYYFAKFNDAAKEALGDNTFSEAFKDISKKLGGPTNAYLKLRRDEFDVYFEWRKGYNKRETSPTVANYHKCWEKISFETFTEKIRCLLKQTWCMTFNEFKDSFIPFCETSKTKSGKAHSYYNAIIYLAEFLNIDKINYENSLIILEREKHIKDKNNLFYIEFLNYLSLRKQSSYLKSGFVRVSLPLFHDFIKQQN